MLINFENAKAVGMGLFAIFLFAACCENKIVKSHNVLLDHSRLNLKSFVS
jgi:hypothetical protein